MSLSPSYAKPYIGKSSTSYTYMVYLDGCVRYDEFSKYAISQGATDPEKEEDCPVFNAKEILPLNLQDQTVAADRIVAAINNNENEKSILLNNKFALFNKIKPALIKEGLDEEKSCLKIEIGKLEEIIQNELGLKKVA